jgi:hypothetical protein
MLEMAKTDRMVVGAVAAALEAMQPCKQTMVLATAAMGVLVAQDL